MDVETKQINDLGMITISLTIRKNLDIKYKDKLEITISDNEIILNKTIDKKITIRKISE